MSLSSEEVRKIAMLARLGLTDAEVEKFAGQLTGILDWVDMLSEVDTDGVEPTYQVTGLTNVGENDELLTDPVNPDELIKCTKQPVEARQILVKNVFN